MWSKRKIDCTLGRLLLHLVFPLLPEMPGAKSVSLVDVRLDTELQPFLDTETVAETSKVDMFLLL